MHLFLNYLMKLCLYELSSYIGEWRRLVLGTGANEMSESRFRGLGVQYYGSFLLSVQGRPGRKGFPGNPGEDGMKVRIHDSQMATII